MNIQKTNANIVSKRELVATQTVNTLAGGAKETANPVSNMGSVSAFNLNAGNLGQLNPFRASLTSASGASKNYVIGDPSGLLASLKGGTIADVDSWTGGITVASAKATFAYAPVAVKAINYETTSSAAQFSNTFQLLIGDIDGSFRTENIPVSSAKRNNQYNSKLLTIEFEKPIILSWNRALYIVVNDGEDVYLDFVPAAAANRY